MREIRENREGQLRRRHSEFSEAPTGNQKQKALDKFLSWDRKKFIKFAQIGLILFILGLLILNIVSISSSFNFGNLVDEINDLFRVIRIIAVTMYYVGGLLFILSMFTLAIYDEDMHIYLRVALIIAIGLIISYPLLTSYGI